MPIEINRALCIDAEELAKMLHYFNAASFHSARHYQRKKNHPFPSPDFVIGNKFFWKEDRTPEILAWRNEIREV